MDDDGWKVAGGRSRSRLGHKLTARTHVRMNSGTKSGPKTALGPANHDVNLRTSHASGYMYRESSRAKKPPSMEDTVEEEVRKLDRLQELLKQSVLWERTVGVLRDALSNLALDSDGPVGSHPSPPTPHSLHQRETEVSVKDQLHSTPRNNDVSQSGVPSRMRGSGSAENHDERASTRSSRAPPQRERQPKPIPSSRSREDLQSPDLEHVRAPREEERATGKGRERRARLREIVCYGVGKFSESNNSRYQLALALCLRSSLLSIGDDEAAETSSGGEGGHVEPRGTSPEMLFFDPVLDDVEKAILARLGCRLIEENEQGKRRCCGAPRSNETPAAELRLQPTLFFMPHCPQRLYSNVLWANWSFQGA